MSARNVRVSLALTVTEYEALNWYADRANTPTSLLARTLLLEALLPRLQPGTMEGTAYADAMHSKKQVTVIEERE